MKKILPFIILLFTVNVVFSQSDEFNYLISQGDMNLNTLNYLKAFDFYTKASEKATNEDQKAISVQKVTQTRNILSVFHEFSTISFPRYDVFFVGIDNNIEIKVAGFKPEDLSISISNGSIIHKNDHEYIVRVSQKGLATINVIGKLSNNIKDTILTKEYRVMEIPSPRPVFKNLENNCIDPSTLTKLVFSEDADAFSFYFKLQFKVVSFTISASVLGFEEVKSSDTSDFTPAQIALMKKVRRGEKIYIENIKVQSPCGLIRPFEKLVLIRI